MTVRRIPATGSPDAASNQHTGSPTTMLKLLDDTLSDNDRTANAKDLLTTAANAASCVVLSLGVILLAVSAAVMVVVRSTSPGPVVGSAIVGGAGLAWGTRWLCKRVRDRQTGTQPVREKLSIPVDEDLLGG
jgi:hypothetical protein